MEAAERRCQAVRDDSLIPYGALIRSGAYELVSTMFPRFVARRGHDAVLDDIDGFFRGYGARSAPYILMGTEFVRFMLPRLPATPERVLLEYEWMLFDVEIDEAVVPAVEAGVVPTRLRINPTARWLATPFDVLADDALSDVHRQEGRGSYAYAIYRTAEHRVLTQPLGERDIAELRYFDDGERRVSPADRAPWLSEALQRELVVASRARIPPSGG
ncbi:hypothetical protein [Luteibacter jiangsuensis]